MSESITLYKLRKWYKVFWQVLVLNTQTNRKFLAMTTDEREREREREREIGESLRLSTFVFCFLCYCVCAQVIRFLIACASARAKT